MRARLHVTRTRLLCAAPALATLSACSSVGSMIGMGGGGSASQQAADVNASIRSDADIVGVLHLSNMGEINAGNVARQRAQDGEVRNFASMMVRDHSNLDQQGSRMASQWGIAPTTPSNNLSSAMQM